MGSKDNVFDKFFAAQGSNRKSDRRLKNLLRSLRKTSIEQLGAENLGPHTSSHEPFVFGQQVILRQRGMVPVEPLVKIHNLFKNEQEEANEMLDFCSSDDDESILDRCAIRVVYEE